jgi:hypothetical protein
LVSGPGPPPPPVTHLQLLRLLDSKVQFERGCLAVGSCTGGTNAACTKQQDHTTPVCHSSGFAILSCGHKLAVLIACKLWVNLLLKHL